MEVGPCEDCILNVQPGRELRLRRDKQAAFNFLFPEGQGSRSPITAGTVRKWCSHDGVCSMEAWEETEGGVLALVGVALFRLLRGTQSVDLLEGRRFDATGLLLLDILIISVAEPHARGRGRLLRHGLEHVARSHASTCPRIWLFVRAINSAISWYERSFEGEAPATGFASAALFGTELATLLQRHVAPKTETSGLPDKLVHLLQQPSVLGMVCDLSASAEARTVLQTEIKAAHDRASAGSGRRSCMAAAGVARVAASLAHASPSAMVLQLRCVNTAAPLSAPAGV
jgi:hypothetical protein